MHSGVLKRAQWIKYLGVFFNLDGPATDIYNTINTTFYNVAATIDTNISVGAPVLAFADYYSFAPYFAYEISLATYKQQYASVSPSSLLTYAVCSMHFPRFINLLTLQSCTRTDVQVCIQFDGQEGLQCKKICDDLCSSYLITTTMDYKRAIHLLGPVVCSNKSTLKHQARLINSNDIRFQS